MSVPPAGIQKWFADDTEHVVEAQRRKYSTRRFLNEKKKREKMEMEKMRRTACDEAHRPIDSRI